MFGVSPNKEQDLISFINFVSSYHQAIKYTSNITHEFLSFLDITCKIQDDNISTSVLFTNSWMPIVTWLINSVFLSHAKMPFRRYNIWDFVRICRNNQDLEAQCVTMKSSYCVNRGYPNIVLEQAISSLSKVKRFEYMEKRARNISDLVPLDLTYNPHNFVIQNNFIRQFKSIVFKDECMSTVFNYSLPITA